MISEDTKNVLRQCLTPYCDAMLEPSPKAGKRHYVCPICGSGEGKNNTGAFSIMPNDDRWQCFSCGESGDIFDLISIVEEIEDFQQQIERAKEFAGDNFFSLSAEKEKAPAQTEPELEYREYLKKCHAAASKTDYLTARGLSSDAIKRFKLGYDEQKGCIVIPYPATNYYIKRKIKNNDQNGRYFKLKGMPEPLFNAKALQEDKPCFIVEGQLDAISIMDINPEVNAIALGSAANIDKLFKSLAGEKPACNLIIAFDNDDTGKEASKKLATELDKAEIFYLLAEWEQEGKDANEMLVTDKATFQRDIKRNIARAKKKRTAEQTKLKKQPPEEKEMLDPEIKSGDKVLLELLNDLKNGKGGECIPTGFSGIDKELDGGLYPGLYVLGAISSLGKTSLMLQIANNIAAAGHKVLYITLEMSAKELTAKSLSRLMFEKSDGYKNARKTARDFLNPKRYNSFIENSDPNSLEIFKQAKKAYRQLSKNLEILEGVGNVGVKVISQMLQEYQQNGVEIPIIFIDYLQILAPDYLGASDKQNIDKAVLELKRISRDYDVPVFAISSLNRESYNAPVNLTAFKESGAIEYGTDVLIGLQPFGLVRNAANPKNKDSTQKENQSKIEDCKQKPEREMELVILKNRNGQTGGKVKLVYYAKYNCFEVDNFTVKVI